MFIQRVHRFFFTLVFLFFLVIVSENPLEGISLGTRLDLIRGHELLPIRRPISQFQRLKQMLHSDSIRFRSISFKVRLKRKARRRVLEGSAYYSACANGSGGSAGEMRIHAGADYGVGQYFVRFRVGSPSQKLALVADTGSDLTWMRCRYRCESGSCRRNLNNRRIFQADRSSSFKTVPCSSRLCKIELSNYFSLARCPSEMDPCAYDYRYADGSSAVGLFARETVTFRLTNGRKMRLHNVLVGCSESSRGQIFEAADGVIGLGYSNYSFAVKAAKKFGGKFSYCLVDHLSPKNITSYLIFGSHKEVTSASSTVQYTELLLEMIPSFYGVKIKGISLGGTMLEIPTAVWNAGGSGGVIVDSGSSLTFLTQPAYQPVITRLNRSLLGFRKLNLGIKQLEHCFNSTGFDESLVPRLRFHFTDGARLKPPVKSYVIDAAPGVKCLGFVAAAWPGTSVIGNIMQQNHFWEFDIVNSRLGFGRSSCT